MTTYQQRLTAARFGEHDCAWCGCVYTGFPGGVCDKCQREAEHEIEIDEAQREECEECGMDMGEHLRSCPYHRDKLV